MLAQKHESCFSIYNYSSYSYTIFNHENSNFLNDSSVTDFLKLDQRKLFSRYVDNFRWYILSKDSFVAIITQLLKSE